MRLLTSSKQQRTQRVATVDVVTAIISGGVGASIGSIGVAIVQTRGRKGESRATAADLVANAAGGLADRLDKKNKELEIENRELKKSVICLTDLLDTLIPKLELSEEEKAVLIAKNNEAKLRV